MTDSSPEATTPRDATFDRRMIDDLRAYRADPFQRPPYVLVEEELDALLAAADERDAYEREACAEPEAKTTTPDGHSSWPLRVVRDIPQA